MALADGNSSMTMEEVGFPRHNVWKNQSFDGREKHTDFLNEVMESNIKGTVATALRGQMPKHSIPLG